MCDPVGKLFQFVTGLLALCAAGFSLATLVVVSTHECGSWDDLLYLANGGLDDQLSTLFDLSHEPKPFEECTNDPNSGDPCNGLARNDECFVGQLYLLQDDHCNKCCDHLIMPDSCAGSVCRCYANSGCING